MADVDDTFKCIHSANFRFVVEGAKGWWSLDTGENENVMSAHYFDMNKNHVTGDLYRMPEMPLSASK